MLNLRTFQGSPERNLLVCRALELIFHFFDNPHFLYKLVNTDRIGVGLVLANSRDGREAYKLTPFASSSLSFTVSR